MEEKEKAIQAAAVASFKAMLREKGDINANSRWSRVCYSSLYMHYCFPYDVALIYFLGSVLNLLLSI